MPNSYCTMSFDEFDRAIEAGADIQKVVWESRNRRRAESMETVRNMSEEEKEQYASEIPVEIYGGLE